MPRIYSVGFSPSLTPPDIGNARIAGLAEDLNLTSAQYEWLLTSFYITYITFQWMTLLYRIVPAHIYISLCVLSWSLIASAQSLTNSFVQMLVLRALLGVGEAAFSPGVPFLLSFFFKRNELALRTGLFISAAPLATSLAGSLAWLITKAGQHAPIAAWRLLFLVEGLPSIFFAIIAWYQIPDRPDKARFLSRRESTVARLRLASPRREKHIASEKPKLDWLEIREALTDVKCWITAVDEHATYQPSWSRLTEWGSPCSLAVTLHFQACHPFCQPSSMSIKVQRIVGFMANLAKECTILHWHHRLFPPHHI